MIQRQVEIEGRGLPLKSRKLKKADIKERMTVCAGSGTGGHSLIALPQVELAGRAAIPAVHVLTLLLSHFLSLHS